MSGHAADFSGDIPQYYDRGLGPVLFVDYAADIARRATDGSSPERVLEVAAGTGIVTRALRDGLPAGARLTSTDLNPDMLALARTKFRPEEEIVFHQADAMALPFPDRSFNTVICQFGVMFFPNKDNGYQEAHRVLTPGGRYLFSVWDAHRHNPFARIVHEVIGGFFPSDPPTFFAMPFGYYLIDPIKESLLRAGFDRIEVSVIRQHKRVADFSALADGFVFGSPVVDQIRQRGGAAPAEVRDAVAAAMRREFGGEPGIVSMQAIVFSAQKTPA